MTSNGAGTTDELRQTAELLIKQTRPVMYYRGGFGGGGRGGGGIVGGSQIGQSNFDITRTHSINLITEEFLGGYMQDGRMSVVRRFFCLFVTFDLIFVSLLWLICIMMNGDNIFQAFHKQIVHYTIYTSLFDVVAASVLRFFVLIFFYALLYVNHWFIIAFSTAGSCLFLISKVFVFDWIDSNQRVFEVILIIVSFILAWGEAWHLDCCVIPQERHARRYFTDNTSVERTPLIAPFLAAQTEPNIPGSVANFYSPLDSAPNSDDEDDQDEEYHQMGLDCVRKAYGLLESVDWKVEKVTAKGDTIRSTQREKLGKIYRLTGRIKYPAKALLEELFYKIEDIPKWNPTLLESKIVRKINSYTDISYHATVNAGGGIVKSRDFVNLRCWRLYRNGKLVDNLEAVDANADATSDDENILNNSCEGSVSTVSDIGFGDGDSTPLPSSVGSIPTRPSVSNSSNSVLRLPDNSKAFQTLSQSLGAKDFVMRVDFEEPPPLLEEKFEDAKESLDPCDLLMNNDDASTPAKSAPASLRSQRDVVWLSAAISIDYPQVPKIAKYVRGENLVSGFALREIDGKTDACIFEWLLCLDLKGYIPRYILDTAYTTFMTDYMLYLRKYVNELRQKRRKVPRN